MQEKCRLTPLSLGVVAEEMYINPDTCKKKKKSPARKVQTGTISGSACHLRAVALGDKVRHTKVDIKQKGQTKKKKKTRRPAYT